MTDSKYLTDRTALLLVDPYNDFMSEGGKLYDAIKETALAVGMFDHLREILGVVRALGIPVFILPHHRSKPNDFDGWRHVNPTQQLSKQWQVFAEGSWGGEWHPEFGPKSGDVIVHEHWAQSSFANTDLDAQLKQHGIERIILVGFVANTCIESTGRYGMEMGYHVTLVKDATAAFSHEAMHAAHEINGPSYAHAILTTEALLKALKE
ncbi:isochorismatase [Pseudomonas brenneri]|uniref:Cysteine hydrolase n=1 Tax=Pseudomonas brenneri TaxID=129817 RepID=A0A5B2UX78_9PSED|nr:isochorismatase family cysteine hydrolase [Pseudomonas brenneri]KAA2230477.1 cysteine hydrolase [Pseudomonas brenneri]TWR77353.1 cysteine hydrolase [Pseudomonas brenneri]GGL49318.1 isochorismatase [Pseudomonas brenneri]SDU96192.1 Nicotinamidase-related amidase [Pseudomonas brenneri]